MEKMLASNDKISNSSTQSEGLRVHENDLNKGHQGFANNLDRSKKQVLFLIYIHIFKMLDF